MIQLKDFYNIPNSITLTRIASLPLFVYFISLNHFLAYTTTFAWIIISDVIDGFISRKFNMGTTLGEILDPIADKIATLVILTTLLIYKDYPLWLFILIISRDIILIIGGIWLYLTKQSTVKANSFGKLSTFSITALACWFLFITPNMLTYTYIPITITCLSIILATYSYARPFFKQFKKREV